MWPMPIVYPSAGARAICTLPTDPPAPGRFSTVTDWPHASVNFCPLRRARMSVEPPGVNGTIIVMPLFGQAACAEAPVVPTRPAAPIDAMPARI